MEDDFWAWTPRCSRYVKRAGIHQIGATPARYVDEAALAVSEAEISEARAQTPRLEKTIRLERKAHEAKLEGVRARAEAAGKKLERVRYLVESGASPRVALVEAEDAVQSAGSAEREELTAWTSRLDALQGQARAARLVVLKAERARDGELARQWVKAPVAGLVADVRVTGVTTRGVTLEVVVLEESVR